MKCLHHLLIFILFFIYNVQSEKKIPSWVPKCKLPSPDLAQCLINAGETMKPHLAKGIPQMHLPALEPFYIPKITLSQNSQEGNYECIFSDMRMNGVTNYTFHSMKYNYTKEAYSFWMNFTIDKINIDAKYDLNGKILQIPISGHGNFSGNFSDVYGTVLFNLETITKKSNDYYAIKDVKIEIVFQKNKNNLDFDNVIEGNAAISEATTHFLRTNIDVILEDVRGPIEDVLVKIVKDIASALFVNFPINVIFQRIK